MGRLSFVQPLQPDAAARLSRACREFIELAQC
jgi:hypothetical protein